MPILERKIAQNDNFVQPYYLPGIRSAPASSMDCRLLVNSDLTITEVAFSFGYNTPTLFFEQFQKIIHLTPAEYRREINGTAK